MAQVSRTRRLIPEAPAEPEATMAVAPGAPLVTSGFHPLADFANFGPDEALMLLESGADLEVFATEIAGLLTSYLSSRLPRAGISGAVVDREDLEEWLSRSSTGPFDEGFASYLRELTHVGGGSTFPGVNVPLPPQMIVGLMGWLQGELLFALGEVSDTITLSAIGGIWMDELMLQLGIILEPVLTSPKGPRDYHGHQPELHPYADLAGFGPPEGKILGETGALLAPAASGVISLAYTYLLSRPESAGFFSESDHLAQRKQTLKAWWIRTAADPFEENGSFGDYMRKVANAHVLNGGTHPSVEIPPQLTIALMGWVQMRVMTALNTIALDPAGAATFGELGDPAALAAVGRAWMLMLTLQLGVLIDPYLTT
ncbi:MAG TPA: protoglobin domain-containing protein [Actinomycetota bacterium]|nr:protoglobin domain-containing protein [Actinomycetota bacterium]